MPEHSETIHTPSMKLSMEPCTVPDLVENGLLTVAGYVANGQQRIATWIVTTTTEQGSREDWLVQVTPAATL